MIERPDAQALLAGPLGTWLQGQDDVRAAARARASRRLYWGIGIAAAVAFVIVVAGGPVIAAAQIGFVIGGGGFAWSEWTKRPVVNTIKGAINSAVAQALGLSYSIAVTNSRPFDHARAFDLIPGFDKSVLEDEWSGDLHGQPFVLHEARLTEQRGAGKSRRTVTVFAGSLITVRFARAFAGTTLIRRKVSRLGLISALFGERDTLGVNGEVLHRVDTVDPRFSDLFEVWSNDQVEAHYLVNPAYIERLVAVEQAFAADKVRALFREGELLIVLESGNLFESGSLEASDDRALLEKTIAQFATLADLAVRLNERPR